MRKFEYAIEYTQLDFPKVYDKPFLAFLNEKGKNGYELVSAKEDVGGLVTCIFKREVFPSIPKPPSKIHKK